MLLFLNIKNIQIGVYIIKETRKLLMLFVKENQIYIKSKEKCKGERVISFRKFTYGFHHEKRMRERKIHKIYFNILRKHMLG